MDKIKLNRHCSYCKRPKMNNLQIAEENLKDFNECPDGFENVTLKADLFEKCKTHLGKCNEEVMSALRFVVDLTEEEIKDLRKTIELYNETLTNG